MDVIIISFHFFNFLSLGEALARLMDSLCGEAREKDEVMPSAFGSSPTSTSVTVSLRK